jgi:hypothetical protein
MLTGSRDRKDLFNLLQGRSQRLWMYKMHILLEVLDCAILYAWDKGHPF